MNIQRDTYPGRGSESEAKPQWPLPVLDQTSSQFTTTTFNAGTDFTVPAGSANAIVTIQLKYGQILGNQARVGYFGNSTLVLGGALATTLTTEIPFIGLDGGGPDLTKLVTAGQYMVDYETGTIVGKRVDNGTTGTATYNYWLKSSASAGGTGNTTQIASTAIVSGATTPSAITAGEQNVLVDTVYNTSAPTPTNGQRVNLQSDSLGNLKVTIAGQSAGSALADATANPTTTLNGALLEGFNGTTWDRIRAGISAATTTLTGFLNALPLAIYNSSAPTLTNGQVGLLQSNSSGALNIDETLSPQAEDNVNGVYAEAIKPLPVSTYSWTLFQNLGANATLNVKASAGSIKSIYCHNISASIAYIQIHKTATTPGGGAVPALTYLVPASGVTIIDGQVLGENGYFCTTGIAFAYSTTESTYTAGTAANQVTQIMFI